MAIKMKKGGDWVDIKTTTEVDPELKKSFYPAEAKAVGDKFSEVEANISSKHTEYDENFDTVNTKIADLDNHANILHRNFYHLDGITFDTLWFYPRKDMYYNEDDLFNGEKNSMIYTIPDLGNAEKYPWLIITSQNCTLLVHNHTQEIRLSYTNLVSYSEDAAVVPTVQTHSRPVWIDTEQKTITFGDNYMVEILSPNPSLVKGTLNAKNKPYAILGVRDMSYSNYGLEYLLTQSY